MSLKIYIIAGEASGDLHAANLVRSLQSQRKDIICRGWGGDLMQEAGVEVVKHYRELAFMGFAEVMMNIGAILKNFKRCKQDILNFQPDIVLMVDYPGFNLRMAKWAKINGFRTIHYISPTVWAWKESRVFTIKKYIDKLIAILPFEPDFYKKFDYEVDYFGNPLIDAIQAYRVKQIAKELFLQQNKLSDRPIIAVLPGSRKQEIKKKLPLMLEAVSDFKAYQVVIAGAPGLDQAFYEPFLSKDVTWVTGKTYDVLSHAEFAVVTSGTATLETALLKVPQVVCYKTSKLSYAIAKKLVRVKYISLVNLIMDQEVVRELIQDDCSPEKIRQTCLTIQRGGSERDNMLRAYEDLIGRLGQEAVSDKIAQSLLKTIEQWSKAQA